VRAIANLMLVAGLAAVFCAAAALFLQLVPGPHGALDAMVIGSGATLVCQLILFGSVLAKHRRNSPDARARQGASSGWPSSTPANGRGSRVSARESGVRPSHEAGRGPADTANVAA